MSVFLHPHPGSAAPPLRIAVEVAGPALTYRVAGAVERLLIPPRAPPERTDGLWRHTCFEAFVREEDGYREYNFAPSGRWAAYGFRGYRQGMVPLPMPPPVITTERSEDRLVVRVLLEQPLSGRVGLAAVIEEEGGATSFWALRHPPGAPNFHHECCFALDLPSAG